MSLQTELVDRVLHLPATERSELARKLILSLEADAPSPEDIDAAWEAEIERRLEQVDRGEVKLIDWHDSVERIRTTIKDAGEE